MIGLILVLLSWFLLRLESKSLTELGFNAPRLRAGQFFAGLLIAGCVVVIQQLGLAMASGVAWQFNPEIDAALGLRALRSNLNSVLYEELVFRGYLLYQAIRFWGARRGVLLGAAVFGIYHWFSYEIIGEPVKMVFVFVVTGAFGLMLGIAFAKTKSIAAPIGLHLGWNAVTQIVFSGGPFGAGFFVAANGQQNIEAGGVAGLALGVGLPLVFIIGACWYMLRFRIKDGSETKVGTSPY